MLRNPVVRIGIGLVLTLLPACSQGVLRIADADGTATSWHFSSDVGDSMLWASVTAEELVNVPDWDPSAATPAPLQLDQAIRISQAELAHYVPDPGAWEVGNLAIERLAALKWVILVSWVPRDSGVKGTLRIPVLPTGRALVLEEVKVKVGDEAAGA